MAMLSARQVAFAIAAHPDDIEFMMGGTLILLKQAGYEIHYMNIANGSCGTTTHSTPEIIEIRKKEAQAAAKLIGAIFHPSLVDDIDIFYQRELLARVGAIVRSVNPSIVLAPSPDDYMEDHMNASRLAAGAAFCRGMRNFPTAPRTEPVESDVAVYHALPWGLCDGMRRRIWPELYVDIGSMLQTKREMLAQHGSQKEWLDASQGLNAYLSTMEEMSAEVGRMSGRFEYAEGWRRHSHLGFSAADWDPLTEVLRDRVLVDDCYQQQLDPRRAQVPRRRTRTGRRRER